FINHKNDAYLSKELATINSNSPLSISLDETPMQELNEEKVHAFFTELGFKSLIDKLAIEHQEEEGELENLDYDVVEDFTDKMLAEESALHLEMIEENYRQATILGI